MTDQIYEPVDWADVKAGEYVRATLPHTIIEGEVRSVFGPAQPCIDLRFNRIYKITGWTLERRVEPVTLPTGLGAVVEVEWDALSQRYVWLGRYWYSASMQTWAQELPAVIERGQRPKVTILSEGVIL